MKSFLPELYPDMLSNLDFRSIQSLITSSKDVNEWSKNPTNWKYLIKTQFDATTEDNENPRNYFFYLVFKNEINLADYFINRHKPSSESENEDEDDEDDEENNEDSYTIYREVENQLISYNPDSDYEYRLMSINNFKKSHKIKTYDDIVYALSNYDSFELFKQIVDLDDILLYSKFMYCIKYFVPVITLPENFLGYLYEKGHIIRNYKNELDMGHMFSYAKLRPFLLFFVNNVDFTYLGKNLLHNMPYLLKGFAVSDAPTKIYHIYGLLSRIKRMYKRSDLKILSPLKLKMQDPQKYLYFNHEWQNTEGIYENLVTSFTYKPSDIKYAYHLNPYSHIISETMIDNDDHDINFLFEVDTIEHLKQEAYYLTNIIKYLTDVIEQTSHVG
jgi:hypothetical protein